jgi:hypothetical protein
VAACRQKGRVRFTTAASLVNDLVEAKQEENAAAAEIRLTPHEVADLEAAFRGIRLWAIDMPRRT